MLELLAVAVWCFLVALAGGLVGLVLGNIRLPVILLAASAPATGAAANIAISGVAATAASVTHIRAGRIDWRLFRWMAPPSVAGALVGGYVSGEMPRQALLAVIAAVLILSGIDLLRRRGAATPTADHEPDVRAAALAGVLIGLLGGVVGLILGSLRMPALLRWVGLPATKAVGTNLAVGVLVGVAGLVGHLPNAEPDWDLLAVGAAASVPGALLGARLTGRLSEETLIRSIGAVLVVAGLAAAAEAALG